MSTIAMPPIETLFSHDIAAGQIEFESIVFLRDDYLGPIPIDKRPVTLVAEAWSRLLERVDQRGSAEPKKQAPTGKTDPEKWIGTAEMAERVGLSVDHLLQKRKDGQVPAVKHGSRTIRWNPQRVERALELLEDTKAKPSRSSEPQKRKAIPSSSLPEAEWDNKRVHTKMKQQPKE